MLRIISFYAVLLESILLIPSFQVFFMNIYCVEDSKYHPVGYCYKGMHFVHVIVAVAGVV